MKRPTLVTTFTVITPCIRGQCYVFHKGCMAFNWNILVDQHPLSIMTTTGCYKLKLGNSSMTDLAYMSVTEMDGRQSQNALWMWWSSLTMNHPNASHVVFVQLRERTWPKVLAGAFRCKMHSVHIVLFLSRILQSLLVMSHQFSWVC